MNRQTLEPWIAEGRKTWGAKAVIKAKEILTNHSPHALSGDVQAALDRLRAAALETLAGEHIGA